MAGAYGGGLKRFESFSNFTESESISDLPIFTSNLISDTDEFSSSGIADAQMQGSALREWTRLNTIRLEEKEKREKEVLSQIVDEADEFKIEFYRKREVTVETNMATNRDKEKLLVVSHEKFHAEATGNYWRSIGELIPNEVATIEKKKGKKDEEKKPSIVAINGPKPGKPTDLSRMRQILLKLKHNTPRHLEPSPPTGPSTKVDSATAVATSTEPVPVVVA
ncbi:hypothetical protein K7X08_023145 [Anisodus acutangulus]|uniref:Clathrin light chain n=1 Tax=Anisodus acutangulus TaxID=402998 RepID=A0A9Q1QZ35_9SOLA|nr:hypothetical protein K7X08_023145 [Anisodus acutangulus]